MLNILALLWTFFWFSSKSKNDVLVCFKPVSKPGACDPSTLGILLSQDQSWGQTVTLQARASQIPTRVKAETHSSCLFSGFELQLLALFFPVVQERWRVVIQIGKSLNFLICNLEAPLGPAF